VDRRLDAVQTREALLKVYEDHLTGMQKILNEAAEKASPAAETPDGELKGAGPKRSLKL
jgi:hypothetical protein